ncbi:MAG: preprotein translocase subunit YajC [Bacteroidales bacterium]|nr:preprotein translocase subunit YajC [Bacteroidales bacterium]
MILNFILLSSQGSAQDPLTSMLPLLAVVVVFWLFFIRPQMKKAKEERKYRENLKKGDKVITIGGVHGKVTDIEETTVTLEMIDKTRIKVERSAVSSTGVNPQQMEQKSK